MMLYFAANSIQVNGTFGVTSMGIEYFSVGGVVVGSCVLLAAILYKKHVKKRIQANIASEVSGSKHEAKSEKVKSDIILSGIEDGVVVIGADKIIQLFNPGAANISGWPIDEAEKLEYHSVLQLIDSKGITYPLDKDPFALAFQKKSVIRDPAAILISKSKRQVPIHLNISPIMGPSGAVQAIVGVFRDVSKERQQELQSAEFISTASHEMRTPIAAIEGYLALALNGKVSQIDDKARAYLEKAHSSTQHLGKLFQDLLISSKAEDGRITNHPQIVDLGALLEQVTDSLSFTAQNKGLSIEFLLGNNTSDGQISQEAGTRIIQPLYYVYADPERLRQVITNLFDNAVKYTDKGTVSVGMTGDDHVAQFFIRDSGRGIAPEDIPHLFQKFYTVDSTATRTTGGTGLGLFICRKIIELYDGRIWVESKPGEGSTFYVNLPRQDAKKVSQLQLNDTQQNIVRPSSIQQTLPS